MDYITVIIAIGTLLVGIGLGLIFTSKIKTKKEKKSKQSSIKEISPNEKNLVETNDEPINDKFKVQKSDILKKDILDKKEEIEDLEDEISDLERINKRNKEEKEKLEDNLYSLEREIKQISEINKKRQEKLELVEKQNVIQKESLNFVSEILNANNATNEEFLEIDHKTWEILSHIENDLKYSLQYLENNIINDEYLYKCWNWYNQEIKTWIKNKKVVAIVGEFSAGKTSIVNRILRQDDPNAIELPVKSTETTAIPTYISRGIDFNCQFYSPSGDLKNISSESFQKVTKSLLDDINISSLVKYFVLSYNNKNLSDISLLDTPGFGSNSNEIINKTTEVVKEADALFWVVDANTGEINSSSIAVIKNNLHNIPLYIIINKSDTKSQKDLEDLKSKIEETLNKNNIDYQQVIFFSNEKEIDELITILNSISTKNNLNVVSELNNQIDITLSKARNKLKELKIEETDLWNHKEVHAESLVTLISDIDYSVEDMESVIKEEDSFWREKYYKITKNDYKKFNAAKKKIIKSSSEIPVSVDKFFNVTDIHSEKKEDVSVIKQNITNLEKSKKVFEKIVNEYNPKLIN